MLKDIQIVILAGGMAKRMGIKKPKALIKIDKNTLLDRTIKQLLKYGAKNFIILYGKHKEIVKHVSRKYKRFDIKFYPDPPFKPGIAPGKGLALRHALKDGAVERKRSIFVFPDDVILDDKYPEILLKAHLIGIKRFNTAITVLFTKGQKYPFGAAKIRNNGIVQGFEEKPIIRIPTNTGIFIAEPEFFDAIEKYIPLNSKIPVEWEKTVFPFLAKKKKIYSCFLPVEMWIPVNTVKELEEVRSRLAQMSK
ncbi:MAG: sugar phosphate nucleotidyltransferase [Candidatus Aenigmatarchaeota archaeon]